MLRGWLSIASVAFVAVVVAQVPATADTVPGQSARVTVVVPGNSESRIEQDDAPKNAQTVASAQSPLPIYDASGALVAYTSAAGLSGRKGFVPVLDGNGAVVGYHLVLQPSASANPSRLVADPGQRTCQNATDNAAAYAGGSSNPAPLTNSTKWSRNFRYIAQGADAFVSATAIQHGAVSRGLFGFIRSPIGFLAGEAVQDFFVDRTTASTCPSVQNLANLGLGLSAVINAFRSSAP